MKLSMTITLDSPLLPFAMLGGSIPSLGQDLRYA